MKTKTKQKRGVLATDLSVSGNGCKTGRSGLIRRQKVNIGKNSQKSLCLAFKSCGEFRDVGWKIVKPWIEHPQAVWFEEHKIVRLYKCANMDVSDGPSRPAPVPDIPDWDMEDNSVVPPEQNFEDISHVVPRVVDVYEDMFPDVEGDVDEPFDDGNPKYGEYPYDRYGQRVDVPPQFEPDFERNRFGVDHGLGLEMKVSSPQAAPLVITITEDRMDDPRYMEEIARQIAEHFKGDDVPPLVDSDRLCYVCKIPCTKTCGACKTTYYCSRECQLKNHRSHKLCCVPFEDAEARILDTMIRLGGGASVKVIANTIGDPFHFSQKQVGHALYYLARTGHVFRVEDNPPFWMVCRYEKRANMMNDGEDESLEENEARGSVLRTIRRFPETVEKLSEVGGRMTDEFSKLNEMAPGFRTEFGALTVELGKTRLLVKEFMETHGDGVKTATNGFNTLSGALIYVFDVLKNAFNSLLEKAGAPSWMIENAFVVLCIALIAAPIVKWGFGAVFDALRMMKVVMEGAVNFVYKLVCKILNLFDLCSVGCDGGSDQKVANAGDDTQGIKGATLLLSMIFLAMTKDPKKSYVEHAVKVAVPIAGAVGLGCVGMKYLIEQAPESIQKFFVATGLYRPFGELSRGFSEELAKLAGFRKIISEKGKDLTINEKRDIIKCFNKVIATRFGELAGKSSAASMYTMKLCDDMQEEIIKFVRDVEGRPRPTPMALYLFGPAGQGKSTFVEYISNRLFANGSTYKVKWSRSADEAYWSGWNEEPVIVYDDVFQGDPKIVRQIMGELIRLNSTQTFVVNRAGCADKGFEARPELTIVATNTNPWDLKFDGVTPDAFLRRFVYVRLIADRKVCNSIGVIDPKKILDLPQIDRDTLSYLKFRLYETKRSNGNTNLRVVDAGMDLNASELLARINRGIEVNRSVDDCLVDGVEIVRNTILRSRGEDYDDGKVMSPEACAYWGIPLAPVEEKDECKQANMFTQANRGAGQRLLDAAQRRYAARMAKNGADCKCDPSQKDENVCCRIPKVPKSLGVNQAGEGPEPPSNVDGDEKHWVDFDDDDVDDYDPSGVKPDACWERFTLEGRVDQRRGIYRERVSQANGGIGKTKCFDDFVCADDSEEKRDGFRTLWDDIKNAEFPKQGYMECVVAALSALQGYCFGPIVGAITARFSYPFMHLIPGALSNNYCCVCQKGGQYTYWCNECFHRVFSFGMINLSYSRLSEEVRKVIRDTIDMTDLPESLRHLQSSDPEIFIGFLVHVIDVNNPVKRWKLFVDRCGLPDDVRDCEIEEGFRRAGLIAHPDKGGVKGRMEIMGNSRDDLLSMRNAVRKCNDPWFTHIIRMRVDRALHTSVTSWRKSISRPGYVGVMKDYFLKSGPCLFCGFYSMWEERDCCPICEPGVILASGDGKVPSITRICETTLCFLDQEYWSKIFKDRRYLKKYHFRKVVSEWWIKALGEEGVVLDAPESWLVFLRSNPEFGLKVLLRRGGEAEIRTPLFAIKQWKELGWPKPVLDDEKHWTFNDSGVRMATSPDFDKMDEALKRLESKTLKEKLEDLYHGICSFIRREDVMDIVKLAGIIVGFYATYKGAKALVSFFNGKATANSNEEDIDYANLPAPQAKIKMSGRANSPDVSAILALANDWVDCEEANATTNLSPESRAAVAHALVKIKKSLVCLKRPKIGVDGKRDEQNRAYVVSGLMIGPRSLIMPFHFWKNDNGDDCADGEMLSICIENTTFVVPYKSSALQTFGKDNGCTQDICVLDLNQLDGKFGDRTHQYDRLKEASEQKSATLKDYAGFFFYARRDKEFTMCQISPSFESGQNKYRSHGTVKAEDLYIYEQMTYTGQGPGFCGGVVLGVKAGGETEILAMHTMDIHAGRDGPAKKGFATIIDRSYGNVAKASGGLGDGFIELTEPVRPRCGPLPNESDIRLSLIGDAPFLDGVTREPACLGNPNDPRTVKDTQTLLMEEVARQGTANYNPEPYDEEECREVFEGIWNFLSRCYEDQPFRVLTEEEALNGRSHPDGKFAFLKPIAVRKSAGWPWNCLPGARGKRGLVDGDVGNYRIVNPLFRRAVDKVKVDLLNGAGFYPIICYLKDELRSKAKVMLPRVTQCLGFEIILYWRMYCGAFVNFVHSVPIISGSGVGMNPFSRDWNILVRYLFEVGNYGFDGDYKKFEAYLVEQIGRWICWLMDKFYDEFGVNDDEARAIRKALVHHMINGIILVNNRFYVQRGALKSGVFGTSAIFGYLMNLFLLRLAWLHIMRDTRFRPQYMYDKHVRLVTFGDDNINGVSDLVRGRYNFNTVRVFFESIGVTYTPPYKDMTVYPDVRPICELSFLKLTTRVDDRFPGCEFVPVPSREDILPTLKWVRNGLAAEIAIVTNANDVLRRCVCWPKREWEHLRSEIALALIKARIDIPIMDYQMAMSYWDRPIETLSESFFEALPCKFTTIHVPTCPDLLRMLQLPEGVSIREVKCANMETASAPEMQDTSADGGPKIELGRRVVASGEPSGGFVIDGSYPVSELCKRFAMFSDMTGPSAFPMSLFMCGIVNEAEEQFQTRPGHLHWWKHLYAFWWGDMKMYIPGVSAVSVTYANIDSETTDVTYMDPNFVLGVDPNDSVSQLNQVGTMGMTNTQWTCPNGAAVATNLFHLPCVAPYRMFNVPCKEADAQLGPYGGSNLAVVRFQSYLDKIPMVMVAGGDNFTLMWPWQVPLVIRRSPIQKEGDEIKMANMDMVDFGDVDTSGVTSGDVVGVNNGGFDDIGEKDTSFNDFAKRWQFIANGSWGVLDPTFHSLFAASVPFGFLGNVNRIPFDQFTYFSGDLEIRIKLQSQPFQQGKLIAVFVPNCDQNKYNRHLVSSKISQTMGFNACLYAGGTRDLTIRIPFISYLSSLHILRNAGTSDGMPAGIGWFQLQVFNTLKVGPDAPQEAATWSLFASFPEPKFQILRPRADPTKKAVVEEEKFEMVKQANGGVLSAAGMVSNVASATLETIDFAKKMQKRLGGRRDYPALGVNGIKTFAQDQLDLSLVRQVYPCRTLGFVGHEGNNVTVNQLLQKELTIGEIVGKSTWFDDFPFDSNDGVGDMLFRGLITVAPEAMVDHGEAAFGVTSMEYAAYPFAFWRGKLRVRLECIGTSFHSGRLAFVTCYGENRISAVSIDEAFSQYAHVIDIGGESNVWDFVLDYKSNREMLRVPHPYTTTANWWHYMCGVYQIIVLNPLQYSSVVANQVTFNVYLSMEDVSFKFASSNMVRLAPFNPYQPPA